MEDLQYGLKKLSKIFFHLFYSILEKDYSSKGERQAETSLDKIRKDHIGRYKFACRFIKNSESVLDCACGVGYGSFIMAKETNLSKIIAVEKDKCAIKFAKKYYDDKKIEYRVGDIFHINLPDEYFDCIISFETVEHVDGEALVKLFYKKLKRSGLLIVSVPNQNTQPFDKNIFPFHLRHYTPQELNTLLNSNSFEVIEKHTQYNREKEDVAEGWDGLFNIAIAKKL